jgi:hypothetical protein
MTGFNFDLFGVQIKPQAKPAEIKKKVTTEGN